ncbi:syntaxin 1B/2/3 [Pseudohyphozyma bogoriensis]|nr:syntaxin 1B/2/3 [Pseudohyphozyma bogoriensis]
MARDRLQAIRAQQSGLSVSPDQPAPPQQPQSHARSTSRSYQQAGPSEGWNDAPPELRVPRQGGPRPRGAARRPNNPPPVSGYGEGSFGLDDGGASSSYIVPSPPLSQQRPPLASGGSASRRPTFGASGGDGSYDYVNDIVDGYGRPPSHVPGPSPSNQRPQRQSSYFAPPPPRGGAYRQDSYGDFSEKGSSANLVEKGSLGESQDSYEMKQRPKGKTIKAGDVEFESMDAFFAEISDLQSTLRGASDKISEVQSLHLRLFDVASADDPQHAALSSHLASSSASTRALFSSLQQRLRALEQGNANLRALIPVGQSVEKLSLGDVSTRQMQVTALKEKFKQSIQRFAEVEREARSKNRGRMERQVRIVNPDLGDSEIKELVRNAEEGAGGSLFSQALLQSNGQRAYAARGVMKEVESRAAELARIEETLVELAQLFNDMALIVEAQDIQILEVERQAVSANNDMEQGVVQTKKAVVSARRARKWRWICFGIIVLLLVGVPFRVIAAVVVVFEVVLPLIKKNNAKDSSTSSASSDASSTSGTQLNAVASQTTATSAPTSSSSDATATSSSSSIGVINTKPITQTDYVSGSGNGGFLQPTATGS